jgi:hypothetical protein
MAWIWRILLMIKKLDASEIRQILDIKDDLGMECPKDQYVQTLMSKLIDPKILIAGDIDDKGKLKCYMVLRNNVVPPMSWAVSVWDMWSPSVKDRIKLGEYGKQWAKEQGAKRIIANTPNDDKHSDEYMALFGMSYIGKIYSVDI